MNPWELLYSFVGSFLGVSLTLLIALKKSRNDRIKTKANLEDELIGIKELMADNEEAQGIIHFETPIWSAVIATGSILAMLRDDEQFYNKLLVIYGKISGLRKREEMFPDSREEIIRTRKEIINEICEVIK